MALMLYTVFYESEYGISPIRIVSTPVSTMLSGVRGPGAKCSSEGNSRALENDASPEVLVICIKREIFGVGDHGLIMFIL